MKSLMNFAQVDNVANGTNYSITCINNSTVAWTFFIYQRMPNQPSNIFSLAWLASPYRIAPGAEITFTWSIDYSVMWAQSGQVVPGVIFNASQYKPCSLTGENQTTFSMDNNMPQISDPISGGQPGSLTINSASNIPNNVFSTGIGMSGQATFVQQAYANTQQVYIPKPEYYIAAATQIQMGSVLAETIAGTSKFNFPMNVYKLIAKLGADNTWTIR